MSGLDCVTWNAEPPSGDILSGDATSYIQPQFLLNLPVCEGVCDLHISLIHSEKDTNKKKKRHKLPLIGIIL